MSKIAQALGSNYEQKRKDIFIRKFELNGFPFQVRIPMVSESDAMYQRIANPDEQEVEKIYQQIIEPLMQFKETAGEEITFSNNDVLIGDRSMREAAKNKALVQQRVVEYIKLLIPAVEGASFDDLTYDEVEAEWPMSVQLALCEKIGEAISPGYKETRGN